MKFRQANKILRRYAKIAVASVGKKLETRRCNYNKAVTIYHRHFKKGKKKITSKTIMTFVMPCL